MKWRYTRTAYVGGRFQIVASKRTIGGKTVDITAVRGAATSIDDYSNADPFGDSTAQLTFGALTPFDDLEAVDLITWLGCNTDIDIYWVPAVSTAPQYKLEQPVIDPLTNLPDIVTPSQLRNSSGVSLGDQRVKVWEGYIASLDFSNDSSTANLQAQCQGALFQADCYYAYPFYPAQPWPIELLIAQAFLKKGRLINLRTAPFTINWPTGWKLVVPKYSGSTNAYTIMGTPGSKYSGYVSRQTGAWDHALTGFVQDQLTLMLTQQSMGVKPGDQWTIQQVRQAAGVSPGRAPVLTVRSSERVPDFSIWLGTPGVTQQLSQDSTQTANVIYGTGIGVDGTTWRNAVIANDGSRTDYAPLAGSRDIYPYPSGNTDNPSFDPGGFVREGYTNYGSGFDESDAINVAEQQVARNSRPGWQGTITLATDPSESLPRWLIRAGMTVLFQGFAGSGATGTRFHISSVQANVAAGTMQLTVDTRYRDLLTVEESIARTRDPLTPVKMLQTGLASVIIDDVRAPWDYAAGSGFIPKASKDFHKQLASTLAFPYTGATFNQKVASTAMYPPSTYGDFYVKVRADAPTTQGRWGGPIPILCSEKDTINRTELAAYDYYGRLVKVPFHVSIYYVNVTVTAMPHYNGSYSPYQNDAFEKVDPVTGVPVTPLLWPDPSYIVGWGGKAGGILNRAGFWPGRESDGAPVTGELVDEGTWDFDCSQNGPGAQYFQSPNVPGYRLESSDITLYAMIYAEYTEPLYFMGRLFRQNPGTS